MTNALLRSEGPGRTPLLLGAVPLLAALIGVSGPLLDVCDPASLTAWALMLVPLLGLPVVARWRAWGEWEWRFLLLAFALPVLMAVIQLTEPSALSCGWWRWIERSTAIAGALVVLAARIPVRDWVRIMGASAAAAAIIVASLSWWYGYLTAMNTVIVGFPHANAFTGTVTPVLLAWTVMLVLEREPVRKNWASWVLLLAGLGSLLAVVVMTGRRGATLAIICVLGWFAWRLVMRRSRWLGLMLVAAFAAMTCIGILAVVDQPVIQPRYQRVLLYGAGWNVAADGGFQGLGHYAAFHAQWSDGETARRLTAMGQWMAHAHNEFLDVLMDGGVVALALFAGALVVSWTCVLKTADLASRAAGEALLVACGVHLMTDNFLGQHIGQYMLWVIMAVVISGAYREQGSRVISRMVAPGLAVIVAGCCLIGCWMGASAAFIRWGATEAVKMRVLESSWNPQVVDHWTRDLALAALAAGNVDMAQRTLDAAAPKIGRGGSVAALRRQLALMQHDDAALLDAVVLLVDQWPFEIAWYHEIHSILRREGSLRKRVPDAVMRRLRLLADGVMSSDEAEDSLPTIDSAIDAWASIYGRIGRSPDWKRIGSVMRTLVRHYGDMPGVVDQLISTMMAGPPECFAWVDREVSAIAVGYWTNHQRRIAAWTQVLRPEQARRVMPLIRILHPAVIEQCEVGKTIDIKSSGDLDLRNRIVAIWGLSRLEAR